MARFGRRALALGALAAGAIGVVLAVTSGLVTRAPATSGVAAARATLVRNVTETVRVGSARVTVTRKAGGAVCFRAPHVASCAPTLSANEISYGTGHIGTRQVLAGVAGRHVRAVIARLTRGGTVWPKLRHGVFYAVLPRGYRMRRIVKLLAGGKRVGFAVG